MTPRASCSRSTRLRTCSAAASSISRAQRTRSAIGTSSTCLIAAVTCPSHTDFITDYVQFLVNKYATGPASSKFMAGLVSSTGDSVISTFFGYGANDCTSTVPLAPATYKAGLLEFRGFLQPQTDHF